MAQIFVSAGHGGFEDGVLDPGYVLPDTTEAAEMKWLRDMVLAELRSQGYTAVTLPDGSTPTTTPPLPSTSTGSPTQTPAS